MSKETISIDTEQLKLLRKLACRGADCDDWDDNIEDCDGCPFSSVEALIEWLSL